MQTSQAVAPQWWTPRWPCPMDGVQAGLSLRGGGGSVAPYATLNLGDHVGDSAAQVIGNRRRLAATLGLELARVAMPRLVHGLGVERLDDRHAGQGVVAGSGGLEADAVWTRARRLALWITVADCVPVFLADAEGTRVGLVHAGWRGVLGGLPALLVDAIRRAEPAGAPLVAALGPCIGPCCFEVAADLASRFAQKLGAAVVSTDHEHPHVDLPAALGVQLEQLGVDVEPARPPCTRCHPEQFFSHRGAGGQPTGRMVASILRSG